MALREADPTIHSSQHPLYTPNLAPDQRPEQMKVISDFDGTIVNIDTAEYLLERFAKGDWRKYDDLFERRKISFEECLRRQYGMIKEPKQKLLDAVDGVASFRAGFGDLVAFCNRKGITLTILSAGLDFIIWPLLRRQRLEDQVALQAPKSTPTSDGILLDFSGLAHAGSSNFKGSVVQAIKAKGARLAYIGDGFSDFEPIRIADYRFVIKGSRLDKQCRKDHVKCHEIVSFREVVRSLSSLKILETRDASG